MMPARAPLERLDPSSPDDDGFPGLEGSSVERMGMMVGLAPWFQVQEERLKVLRS